MAMSPGAHASGAYRAAAKNPPSPTAGWSLERLRAASDPLLKMGVTQASVKESIDALGRGSRATGDHQPTAGNEMLEEATRHIGESRDAAFRGQIDAIKSSTPKTPQQDANWQGRGDG
jgi:hypothetical protein